MCLAWLIGSSAGTWQLDGLQIFEGCKQQGQEGNHQVGLWSRMSRNGVKASPLTLADPGSGLSMDDLHKLPHPIASLQVSVAPIMAFWDSREARTALTLGFTPVDTNMGKVSSYCCNFKPTRARASGVHQHPALFRPLTTSPFCHLHPVFLFCHHRLQVS